jgi:S1-C subfamily serine protease
MPTAATTGSHLAIPQVVKVFATVQPADPFNPWRRQWTQSANGSGVIIGPGEILTGAHVVAHSTFLQVQKIAESEKAVARVKAVCHDADLALLEVTDERFLRGTTPVEIGELPELRDKVAVVGFPVGGEQVSITEGVVSRVEVQSYTHSARDLLAVTIDAAINPGNSGGPVFKGGRVVGIAFQKIIGAEAMGAMVPAPLIRRFLDAVASARPVDIPEDNIWYHNTENPAMRARLGLRDDERGILVTHVEYGASAWGVLEPDDVLLEVDGLRVGSDGTVRYRDRYRTCYTSVYGDHYVGDEVELAILRHGERRRVKMCLKALKRLVPYHRYDRPPTYFIYGGLVFQPVTLGFLSMWGERWIHEAPVPLVDLYLTARRTEARQEVVVLSSVLADAINVGYQQEYVYCTVGTVNGVAPRDMADFVQLVEASTDRLEIRTPGNSLLVLDPAEVAAVNAEILKRYDVPRDRSLDLAGSPS